MSQQGDSIRRPCHIPFLSTNTGHCLSLPDKPNAACNYSPHSYRILCLFIPTTDSTSLYINFYLITILFITMTYAKNNFPLDCVTWGQRSSSVTSEGTAWHISWSRTILSIQRMFCQSEHEVPKLSFILMKGHFPQQQEKNLLALPSSSSFFPFSEPLKKSFRCP